MTQTDRVRRINLLQLVRGLAILIYASSDVLLPLFISIRSEADFQRQRFWKRTKFLFIASCQSACFILLAINTALHVKSAFLTGNWWDVIIQPLMFVLSLFFLLISIPFLDGYIHLPAKAFVLRTLIDQQAYSVTSDNVNRDTSRDTGVSLPITLQVKATHHQKQHTFSPFDLGILFFSVASPLFTVILKKS